MGKLLLFLVFPLLLVVVIVVLVMGGDDGPEWRLVPVQRGTVVQYATATGRIEPRFEVPVNSPFGGVLTRRFVELGQRVTRDEPLVEVRPVLTDRDMLQAERALLSAEEAEQDARELHQGQSLMGRSMLFLQGMNSMERMLQGVARSKSDAQEYLVLLREGQVEIDGKLIDFLIRAPIDGNVIQLDAEVGQPVVPVSQYGTGTELLVLADLDHPIFRGTVAEIEVGRLREGMPATLDVGALPGTPVPGTLTEISLRSQVLNNATVFDVKLSLTPPPELVLRSGYSAVARIEIARAADALVLPERVVDYRGERAVVRVDDGSGGTREQDIQVGLSDGLTVEVTGGLDEGDQVLERVW